MMRRAPLLMLLSALSVSTLAVESPPAHAVGAVTGAASVAPATSWSPPQALSEAGVPASHVAVAAAGNGDATLVWTEHRAFGTRVVASWRVDGGAWHRSRVLSAPVRRGTAPQVVMTPRRALVAWLSRTGRVMVSQRRDGGRWSDATALTSGRRHRWQLHAALDRRGDVTLVWTDYVGRYDYDVVRAMRRLAGGHWSRPVRVSGPLRSNYNEDPQVTMDDSGKAIVVWLRASNNSDSCPIMSTHRARTAVQWSSPIPLTGSEGCRAPELVTNGRGDSALRWVGSPYEGVRPYPLVAVHPVGQAWRTHRLRPRSSSGQASIAVGARGTVAAAWPDRRSSTVWTSLRPPGGPWKPRVALTPPGQPWLPVATRIAVGGQGTIGVVWLRSVGNGVYDLQGTYRPAGGTWQAVEPVSQGGRVNPRAGFCMAMDAQDSTVVAWTHREQGTRRVIVTTR